MHDHAILAVRVVSIALQIIGLICTIWRIYFRLKIGRFWWEDTLAAVVLFACLGSLIGECTFWLAHGLTSYVGFWFYYLGFNTVVRATHLSILFSIIRIIHETRLRRFTYFCAACVGIFWAVVISGKIWKCASSLHWHQTNPRFCVVTRPLLTFEITSDCVTVAVLIALPLRMLWRVKLPTHQRRMILSIFASSVVLAFSAIFHIVARSLNITVLVIAGIDSQIASSIIVCNLLVVVTCAYRFLWQGNNRTKTTTSSETESESDDFTRRVGEPLTLTTIELDPSISMTLPYTTRISEQSGPVLAENMIV